MHEQRLYRMLKDASKSLEDLKAKRIAARQADLDAAREQRNLNKMLGLPNDPAPAGFVFTPEEIDTECRRHRRLLEAKIAQECNYDRKKFRQQLASASSKSGRSGSQGVSGFLNRDREGVAHKSSQTD